jgi:type I restriction enzyme S subunit
MGSEWLEKTIGDVCYVTDGAHSKVSRVEEGVMYLTSKNIGNGKLKLDKFDYISEESHSKLFTDTKKSQRRLRTGDVLMGIIGTFGNCYVYKEEDWFGISSSVAILRPIRELVLPEYLYYVISSEKFKATVNKFKGGSVQGYTNIATLKALPILIPAIEVQRNIVNTLMPNDKKIYLNQQTNQTLEQMAQALFKSWFVDFDPVIDNALAAGIEIPDALQHRVEIRKKAHTLQKQNPNLQPLPAATQRLFPSEFEHCGDNTFGIQGWIPKGWASTVLASIAELSTSRMDGAQLTLENYISTENMLPHKQGVTKASSIPQLKTTPSFKAGHVLISNIRPYFKKIWLANRSGGRSNDVLGFQSIEPRTESYLMNLLSQDSFFDFMMTTAKGSKMPRGDKKAIMDWGVVVPPVKIRKFYSNLVESFYSANSIRTKENDSLVQLRDTLLPKLISGEVILESQMHHEKGV